MKAINRTGLPEVRDLAIRSVALAAYFFSQSKRRSIGKNLSRVFGERFSKAQKREITRKVFQTFWEESLSVRPFPSERAGLKRIEVHGRAHLNEALQDGKGVLLWESYSFGRRGLGKQILHEQGISVHQVHGARHFSGFLNASSPATWVQDHVIKSVLETLEKEYVSEIIYLTHSESLVFTRILFDRLRQNRIVCIQGDGIFGRKQIALPFLGTTAVFVSGVISLAKISGAAILPIFCFQEKDHQTRLVIEPPIRIETSAGREHTLEHGVTQYARLFESYIMKYPEQYHQWARLG
jgi:KDO2-lipid IV(A) lauroyltransferase